MIVNQRGGATSGGSAITSNRDGRNAPAGDMLPAAVRAVAMTDDPTALRSEIVISMGLFR